MHARKLATALGWFSIGLGLVELFGGRRLGRWLGVPHRSGLVRLFGLREMASGIGILAGRDPRAWLNARVVGDALDAFALLGALRGYNPERPRVALALATVAGAAALDCYAANQAA